MISRLVRMDELRHWRQELESDREYWANGQAWLGAYVERLVARLEVLITVLENTGHSAFTGHLLEGLASEERIELDAIIAVIDEAISWLDARVSASQETS